MYLCIYVSMYLRIYVSMMYLSIYVSIYVSMILCIYVSTYLRIYVSMYLCIYVSMYLCMYVCMYVSIYLSIYLCIYLYIISGPACQLPRPPRCRPPAGVQAPSGYPSLDSGLLISTSYSQLLVLLVITFSPSSPPPGCTGSQSESGRPFQALRLAWDSALTGRFPPHLHEPAGPRG
jgi:hypothetical protein